MNKTALSNVNVKVFSVVTGQCDHPVTELDWIFKTVLMYMTWDYSVERQKWKKLLSTETEIETAKEDFTKKRCFLIYAPMATYLKV